MVICPIARAVHCTGCVLVKFCPAKTILGDFGKTDEVKPTNAERKAEEKPVEKTIEKN
ncbi:MAG: hypothetical protein P4L53_15965 [Candidatus Obscuribacterales bacterium]|nr:hypothetical protein [Candidatus Obscuribacterales bacterium]